MALSKEQIEQYLKDTKTILLATVTGDNTPDIRILGAIGTIGTKVYFSTASNARKVAQIKNNPNVAVYFETPGQSFPNYINATLYGKAEPVTSKECIDKAAAAIRKNLPDFELTPDKSLYVVKPEQIKIFNSSAELAQDKVQIIEYKTEA